jgi:signal transduction histidine kinase
VRKARLTVATLMFALAAAAYVGTEAAIVTITGDPPPSGIRVLIVVGVAAGFHPVMRWVRASVNEMLFGGRADPVAPARRGSSVTDAVLSLVSVPVAQALHAAHLTEDLRASRGRAVTALEEERRRMRRDLHVGLGPILTGITYSADAVTNLLQSNPSQALEILHALRGEARDAIAEIRRIAYGLRPRALDELGLIGAVQQQVSRLRTADGRSFTVTFDAAQDMSNLPAAVEVAAYRMAVEALTNVARHSGVAEESASFALTDGPVLRVTVQDRGRSVSAWTPGVGITSMRERVEQVGGTLWMHAGTDGATVTAEIPLPA